MTNEETIKSLKKLKSFHNGSYGTAIDEAIKALEQQPCEDCISRQAVIEHICESKECYKEECKGRTLKRCPDLQWVFDLPSEKPKYTDEEIQKMQELEQAQLEKAYELGKTESFEEWLSSFNTESAPQCFNAVQQLKEKLNGQMD